MIIPLFSSSASRLQGGIFTLEKAGDREKTKRKRGPVSLCDLAKAEKLPYLTLVESNMISFMQAHKNLTEISVPLRYGLKLVVCDDMADKSEASFKNESKVVVFLKRDAGYQALIALFTKAATDGFYYVPRIDWKTLCAMWSDDLLLAMPFYSSFLARNTLTFASIVPQMPSKPLLFREMGQQMPMDRLLNNAVDRYVAANSVDVEPVKSIYYMGRKDAKAFLIYRCILERGATWDMPKGDWMVSDEFCIESWKELTA